MWQNIEERTPKIFQGYYRYDIQYFLIENHFLSRFSHGFEITGSWDNVIALVKNIGALL